MPTQLKNRRNLAAVCTKFKPLNVIALSFSMTIIQQLRMGKHYLVLLLLPFTIMVIACDGSKKSLVSTDLASLEKLVILDVHPASVEWEIFGTPEDTGGVPGPTDYMTLVAQIKPVDAHAFARRPLTQIIQLAPEARRAWLVPAFKSLLDTKRGLSVDLSGNPRYRKAHGTLRLNGTPINGFACTDGEKMLVYLTLIDASSI